MGRPGQFTRGPAARPGSAPPKYSPDPSRTPVRRMNGVEEREPLLIGPDSGRNDTQVGFKGCYGVEKCYEVGYSGPTG